MHFNYYRRGRGKPLLLHGLGSSWRSWTPVLADLTAQRDVIALDLPGFGHTAPLVGKQSVATLADAVTGFLSAHGLLGIDAVGSSMGARLVLELARRGVVGAVVSLDPGGFQRGWEKPFFYRTGQFSLAMIRLFQPLMPALTANPIGRSVVYAQYSTHPWALDARLSLIEMQTYAAAPTAHEPHA
ncbi:alpha/beta fold hydrolase [Deinococcus sp. KNUC1210]|uniref:alpha/beta fold hydrolase n=1 Tax=Deinococcus sp. KNUC1210 TaxID=2917691 RepID=UPI00351D25D0